jgi:hypothetical protein
MFSLWLSIEPRMEEVRLSLAQSLQGTALRARLPSPTNPEALRLLLEALVTWFGQPLCAVLDADGEDVRRRPEFWSRLIGVDENPRVVVEWVSVPTARRRKDSFLKEVPSDRKARQLIGFAASGHR